LLRQENFCYSALPNFFFLRVDITAAVPPLASNNAAHNASMPLAPV